MTLLSICVIFIKAFFGTPEKVVPENRRVNKMSLDIMFTLTIACTMYVAWYAYRGPSGVNALFHVLTIAAAVWLLIFFVYFMVIESPNRPGYHTTTMCLYYCTVVLTCIALYEGGSAKARNKLRDNRSR